MDFIDEIEMYANDIKNVAQIYRESSLTYKELKDKSDALASYIIEKYGEDKSPIVIYGHKQHEMIISFLACSKSGHAYIPIDVTFPLNRVKDILEDSQAKLFVNIGNLDYNSSQLDIKSFNDINNIINDYVGQIPDRKYRVDTEENYYILYTSGSTGKPKGVQITKGCMENFMNWFSEYCNLSQEKNLVMNQISYCFDVSVISIYISLKAGMTLFVIDKNMIEDYQDLFYNFKISDIALWVSTPSFVEMCLMDDSFNNGLLPQMEKMILAGEVLTKKMLAQVYKKFPEIKIINGYGPTEATVLVTAVEITEEMMNSSNNIPIGYPINNCKIVFLDEEGKEVPIGEKGELVIIGDSVSTGYYNNEEVTKKVFFECEEKGILKRAYRTGDLAYVDDKGIIYYCGRKDFQVKLNGYRIEIEDIENNIRNLELVNNTVVFPVYREGKISHLTAFVTLNENTDEKGFKVSLKIKEELKKLIPSYMVPRNIIIKNCFPINPNGKINRNLLMEELK